MIISVLLDLRGICTVSSSFSKITKDKQSKQQLWIDLLQRYVLQEVHIPEVFKNGNDDDIFANGKWEIVTVGKVDKDELIITKSGINERGSPAGLP